MFISQQFEELVLRLGNKTDIIENTMIFSLDYGEIVEAKPTIKDLGILVDDKLSYEDQLFKAVSKTKQKAAWVHRNFSPTYVSHRQITKKMLPGIYLPQTVNHYQK